jgi:hypothetical protein
MVNLTKTEVMIIADIVLIIPCLSIQLAINPGIILPITSYEKVSIGEKK